MLDFNHSQSRIEFIDQEDRAMLRSNPSAWLMPEDGREHMVKYMLLSSCSSFGYKAINLLSWCSAPTKAKHIKTSAPVGHMSAYLIRCPPDTRVHNSLHSKYMQRTQFQHWCPCLCSDSTYCSIWPRWWSWPQELPIQWFIHTAPLC